MTVFRNGEHLEHHVPGRTVGGVLFFAPLTKGHASVNGMLTQLPAWFDLAPAVPAIHWEKSMSQGATVTPAQPQNEHLGTHLQPAAMPAQGPAFWLSLS